MSHMNMQERTMRKTLGLLFVSAVAACTGASGDEADSTSSADVTLRSTPCVAPGHPLGPTFTCRTRGLAPPIGLYVKSDVYGQLNLGWNDGSDQPGITQGWTVAYVPNATGQVPDCTSGGLGVAPTCNAGRNCIGSLTVYGLEPNTDYAVGICANANGETTQGSSLGVQTPELPVYTEASLAPRSLKVTKAGFRDINLSWTFSGPQTSAVQFHAAAYDASKPLPADVCNGVGAAAFSIASYSPPGGSLTPSTTTTVLTGVEPNTSYTITLCGVGTGPYTVTSTALVSQPIQASAKTGNDTSTAAWVKKMYTTILQRSASATEIGGQERQLDEGRTRVDVANGIVRSHERHRLDVAAAYTTVLRRDAEEAAIAGWAAQLDNGATQESMLAAIYGSDEYYANVAHGTASGFVGQLYVDILGRAAESGGLATFTTQLAQGASRASVASALLGSHERHVALVSVFYTRFLCRAPDAGGLAANVAPLDTGKRDEDIEVGFLASDEYFSKAACK
jgi:hypothetical protein